MPSCVRFPTPFKGDLVCEADYLIVLESHAVPTSYIQHATVTSATAQAEF